MSQDNAEILRLAIDAFNQRDARGFDALLGDDAVIVPVRAAREGTGFRGPSAGSQYCAAVEQTWDALSWDLEDVKDGGDWVLALGHVRGAGCTSGVAIDARGAWLAHFNDARITHFQTYPDRREAMSAVGLEA